MINQKHKVKGISFFVFFPTYYQLASHLFHDVETLYVNSFALDDTCDDAPMHGEPLSLSIAAVVRFLK